MATEILKLTKDCPEATIKSYFQGILKLTRENKEFPVDLDDVWMLVYSRRDKAISSLKEHFIQNVDYVLRKDTQITDNQFLRTNAHKSDMTDKQQTNKIPEDGDLFIEKPTQSADNQFFHQKVENSKRGRPIEKYYLTVSCLEFFIARKIRAVFEVYRQVFHKVAEKPQRAIPYKPTSKETLRLTSESTREEIEAYFLEIKMKCADNNRFPVPVDEVWGMRFTAKRRVMDKLLGRNGQPSIFVYDRDYTQEFSGKNRKDTLGKYFMSVRTFQRIMVEPVQLYNQIFEKVFSSDYSIVPKGKSGKQTALQKSQAKTNEHKAVLLDSIIKLYEINKVAPSNTLEEIMENMMKISKEL